MMAVYGRSRVVCVGSSGLLCGHLPYAAEWPPQVRLTNVKIPVRIIRMAMPSNTFFGGQLGQMGSIQQSEVQIEQDKSDNEI